MATSTPASRRAQSYVFIIVWALTLHVLAFAAYADDCGKPSVSGLAYQHDAAGIGTVSVSYGFPAVAAGNFVQLWIDNNIWTTISPADQSGTWTANLNSTCWRTGTHTIFALATSCGFWWDEQYKATSTTAVAVNTTPVVSGVQYTHDSTGAGTLSATYQFPNTAGPGERWLQVWIDGQNGNPIYMAEQAGSWSVPLNITCWPTGSHRVDVLGVACNQWGDEAFKSMQGTNIDVDTTPKVSGLTAVVDDDGICTVTANYEFPNTAGSGDRWLQLWIDGQMGNPLPMEEQSGTWTTSFPACMPSGEHTIDLLGVACNQWADPLYKDLEHATFTVEHKPKVSIEGFEKRPDGTYALVGYEFPQTNSPSQRLLELRRSSPDALIATVQAPERSGIWEVPMVCEPGVLVYATAKACSDPPVISEKDSMPADCELSCKLPGSGGASGPAQLPVAPPASSCCIGDPVHVVSGSMELDDGDPLPGGLVAPLQRTYQSRNAAAGAFGTGWTTILDARASAAGGSDGRDGVFLILEDGRRTMFRRRAGVYVQTYPSDGVAPGTLAYDAARDALVHQDAGSMLSRVFRISDGRLAALVDRRGEEVTVTYDGSGKATSVADAAGRWSWSISWGSSGFIDSIAVAGQSALVWSYAYSNAKLVTVTAPGNATWRTYVYGSAGIEEVRDGRGAVIERHEYDASGRARSSFGSSGELTDIQFDVAGRVPGERRTRVIAADGKSTDYYSRFIAGRMRTVEVAGSCNCGFEDSVFVHDASGNVTREQNGKGWVTVRSFADGRVASVTTLQRPANCEPETDSAHCRQTPDSLAAVALVATPLSLTTAFTYADPNWPERATVVTTGSVLAGQQRTEAVTYDASTGAVLTQTSSAFNPITMAALQRTTQTTLYDGSAGAAFDPCAANASGCSFSPGWLTLPQPLRYVKSVNAPRTDLTDVTEYVYYPFDSTVPALYRGRLAAVKNAAGHIVRYEDHDIFGNARRTVSANGSVTESTYDLLGRNLTTTLKAAPGCDTGTDALCASDIVSRRMYDPPAGPLAIQIGARGEATSYTYDDRGRTLAVTRGQIPGSVPSTAAAAIAAAAWFEKAANEYDAATGRKTAEQFFGRESGSWALKKSESFIYDDDGHVTQVTHADQTSIHYDHGAGELVSIQDENHTAPNTFYRYDPAGRLAAVRQSLASAPNGEITTTYDYDRFGNLTGVTDPNGNLTTYAYDDFGQMVRQVSPVSGQTSYTYGAAGQLLGTTDANGAVSARTYDALGRVTTASSAGTGPTETVSWSYDTGTFGVGQLAGMTDPSGNSSYQYDRRGLLIRETKVVDGTSYTSSFGHDASGNRSSVTYPSGMVISFAFDFAGRPVSAAAGSLPLVISAEYLPFGPVTEVVYGNGTVRNATHDQRYRPLINKLSSSAGIIAQYAYGHDAAGNVTAIDDVLDSTYSRTFGYDALNRLTTANSGASLWGTGAFVYDAMGNLHTATLGSRVSTFAYDATTPLLLSVTSNGAVRPVLYDDAGNEIGAGSVGSSYSPRNLLRVMDERRYAYDGRGIRTVSERPSGLVSLDVPSESGGLGVVEGTATLYRPAPAGGAVVSLSSSGTAASVPASVTIPAGESTGTFPITLSGVTETTSVSISAAYDGVTLSVPLDVVARGLATVTIDAPSLKGGQSATGTVSLSGPAPAGGAAVSLSSSDATRLTVAATVTIPQGEGEAEFTVNAPVTVAAEMPVSITAEYEAVEREVALSIVPPSITSVTVDPTTMEGGALISAVVTLESAAAAGTVVTFSSGSSDVQAPAPVMVSAGAVSVTVPVATSPVATTATAVLTASLAPTSASAAVTLQPAAITLQSFTVAPTSLVGSRTAMGTVTLTAPAPTGGIQVELSAYEDGLVPPFATVAEGMTQATFEIMTPRVAASESRTLHARHSVTTVDRDLQLLPPTQIIDLALPAQATERQVGGEAFAIQETGEVASVTVSHSSLIEARESWSSISGTPPIYEAETQSVTEPVDVMLTAHSNDTTDMVDRLRVVLVPSVQASAIESFMLETSTVTGGTNVSGIVTLSAPAPAGGVTVALSGSRADLAVVPAAVTVPAGETTTSFAIATQPTSIARGVLVLATYGGQTRTAILSVEPPLFNNIGPGPMTSSSTVAASTVTPILVSGHTLYTPELSLMMETAASNTSTKPILHEYVWFAGQPLAQIDTQTTAIHWYFNDHLGTPILQTDATASVVWRAEYEPYGTVFALRAGTGKHQPLRFPGQENEGEVSYNIFRWYRSGWGRYTQADPLPLPRLDLYGYAMASPTRRIDRLGLFSVDKSCFDCGPSSEKHPNAGSWIKFETELRCEWAKSSIIDAALLDCTLSKCDTATIHCDDPEGKCKNLQGKNGVPAAAYVPMYGGADVYVCPENWPKPTPPGQVGGAVFHEFAHLCGWCHGDGSNVPQDPGQDGTCWKEW